jgi:hypothetical protein
MRKTRRDFLFTSSGALAASMVNSGRAQTSPSPVAPDIRSLLQASGFDPDRPGSDSALLAVIGDTHIVTDPSLPYFNLSFDDSLVHEINNLSPQISDTVIAGDLIISHSRATAEPRYPTSYNFAKEEFRIAKQQMSRFREGLRVWAVPGNHDTDRIEEDAELWREELGIPAYQKSVLGGVPVFFLNSGHGGMMDPGQVQWFKSEAALIAKDQEVVVICHYPTFVLFSTYAGTKRVVAEAFEGHRAPVWIQSGHNHTFREDYFLDKGTRFIQMQVTSASKKVWNDGRAAGYTLLGLQGGRVVTRLFRSVKEPGFQVLPSIESVNFQQLRWAFDRIAYPGELFHEGFYNRTGRILSATAVDLKCHFVRAQQITWRVNLGRFGGKIREFLICGTVGGTARPTARCQFSATSPTGPWITRSFPSAAESDADRVYRLPIPEEFLTADTLYVKAANDVVSGLCDVEIAGWGVAATAETLTRYERWISRRYRTFLRTPQTDPEAVPEGYRHSNLELYAFNLLPEAPVSNAPAALGVAAPISGSPVFSSVLMEEGLDFVFARRRAASRPGLSYVVEESSNLAAWTTVESSRLKVRPIDGVWEEVRLPRSGGRAFHRVRVESDGDAGGAFARWRDEMAAAGNDPTDRNDNRIDDLLEFGFDLPATRGGASYYDPAKTGTHEGLPTMRGAIKAYSRLVFARLRQEADPGLTYTIEESADLTGWAAVPAERLTERILRSAGDWEEVECTIPRPDGPSCFYRIHLELTQPLLA